MNAFPSFQMSINSAREEFTGVLSYLKLCTDFLMRLALSSVTSPLVYNEYNQSSTRSLNLSLYPRLPPSHVKVTLSATDAYFQSCAHTIKMSIKQCSAPNTSCAGRRAVIRWLQYTPSQSRRIPRCKQSIWKQDIAQVSNLGPKRAKAPSDWGVTDMNLWTSTCCV